MNPKQLFTAGLCFLLSCSCVFGQAVDSLSVISYNIHHGNPPSKPGVINIGAIANMLEAYPADVIALQEVDVNTSRSGKINEARIIAEQLGMYSFFGKAIDHDGGYYGVALLSKYPLKDTQVLLLPMDTVARGEQRVLVTATISLPSGRQVIIGCTHLDHRSDPKSRELQVAAINDFAKKSSLPFVLAGDLNAEPSSKAIQSLNEVFQPTCSKCPLTFPDINPNRTIDYILYKKSPQISAVLHQVIVEPYISDHLPIRAVVRFEK